MGLWKKYNKYLADTTKPLFELVAANEFNPDIVRVFGMDTYEMGLQKGCLYGTAVSGTLICALYLACYYGTHKKKETE